MAPTTAELLAALPEDWDSDRETADSLQEMMLRLAERPAPTGRLGRMWTLGTMQSKVAAAYFAWWLRSFGSAPDEKQRDLDEAHLKAALQLLGTMSYLRGAVAKAGQMLAAWPDVVPQAFADMLGRLQFQAPPMHFSLLREAFINELGREPEDVFEAFETTAFAAASLGQVHRARLRDSGRPVAVKIQYPNIARTIRDDLANLKMIALPMRLSSDWEMLIAQFDDIRRMLDLEADYEHEAENLRVARRAFREGDGIVVPRVYNAFSTKRVLTMDLLEGDHLDAFMARNPSQALRDAFARRIMVAGSRLWYGPKMLYADVHPGNFLFMPDGRLGFIDFGCCHACTDDDFDYLAQGERAMFGGSRQGLRDMLTRGMDLLPKHTRDEPRMALLEEYCDWLWEPLLCDGPFDFSDETYFRRGVELYGEVFRRRYGTRSRPVNIWLGRLTIGVRAIFTQMKVRVDMREVLREETCVAS